MSIIFNIIKGAMLGIAFVIPGFSGGTMAVLLKIYDRLLDIISLSISKIKENLGFILLLCVGIIIGVIGSSFGLSYLFETYPVPTKMFLVGIIFGSMPMLKRESTRDSKLKAINIIPFLIALGIMVVMFFVKDAESGSAQRDFSFILAVKLFFAGIVASVSMVIPGISGSLMMTVMGLYETVITSIKEFNLPLLLPAGLGIAVGLVGGAKLISVLLSKCRQTTYCAIIGLIVGSVLTIFPSGFKFNTQGFIGIAMLIAGVILPLLFDKKDSQLNEGK